MSMPLLKCDYDRSHKMLLPQVSWRGDLRQVHCVSPLQQARQPVSDGQASFFAGGLQEDHTARRTSSPAERLCLPVLQIHRQELEASDGQPGIEGDGGQEWDQGGAAGGGDEEVPPAANGLLEPACGWASETDVEDDEPEDWQDAGWLLRRPLRL